jgi:hypothetical protein
MLERNEQQSEKELNHLAIGLCLGLMIGLALGNLALGIAGGVALGGMLDLWDARYRE